jgi:signal transduction histidine kinase
VGGVLGLCRDVTEERRREEQWRQERRLTSLDRSCVGLTHDLRNLLTVIRGHLDLLSLGTGSAAGCLGTLRLAADRALELARQFLDRARAELAATRPLDLNDLLEEAAALLAPILGPGVRLEVRKHTPLPAAAAEGGAISRLLLNLGLNAAAAMPCGGRLRLESAEVRFGPGDLAGHPGRQAGRFVCLRVADTGPGLPPGRRERLVQPFQTGRRDGDGFGLGLSVVAAIIEQHRGWMECDSAPGRGACFQVFLPASEDDKVTR